MAKSRTKKRGGFTKRINEKIKNEFVNPKSNLRKAFYKDGYLRNKGLDHLDTASKYGMAIGAMNPAVMPYALGLQTASKGARALDKTARMFGVGKKKRSKKGKGHKSRK
jgi:hypothetical protein